MIKGDIKMSNGEIINFENVLEKVKENTDKFIGFLDEDFNKSSCSFAISNNLNFVVWSDIDTSEPKYSDRYFIMSIRYNEYDDNYGDDIKGLEYSTLGCSESDIKMALYVLLTQLKNRIPVKNEKGEIVLSTPTKYYVGSEYTACDDYIDRKTNRIYFLKGETVVLESVNSNGMIELSNKLNEQTYQKFQISKNVFDKLFSLSIERG